MMAAVEAVFVKVFDKLLGTPIEARRAKALLGAMLGCIKMITVFMINICTKSVYLAGKFL